ncbi:MAG: Redoxin domain protein [Fibrobacteria bacterium]|nr:Redoxin domain protein [Fibrobacteria bacterium]
MRPSLLSAPFLAFLFGLLLSGCESGGKKDAGMGRIPPVSLTTLEGKTYSFGPGDGKVTLAVFWATWCQPCLMEIPSLNEWHAKYRDRGFRVVSINIDDPEGQKMAAIYQKYDIIYPMLMDDGTSEQKFGGLQALPTSFLLGRDGKVRKAFVGLHPPKVVEKAILAEL